VSGSGDNPGRALAADGEARVRYSAAVSWRCGASIARRRCTALPLENRGWLF